MFRIVQDKIVYRIRLLLKKFNKKAETYLIYAHSRNEAHIARSQVVSEKGHKTLDRKTKKKIKDYCREKFGNSDFWPFLALYTEIRGEFKTGWTPEDYYRFQLMPKWNPSPQNQLCNLKTFDHRIFKDFSLIPLFIKISGHFYTSDFKLVSEAEIMDFLKNYNKEIVVKPEFGRGGKDVTILNSIDFDPKIMKSGKNYVIQPFIEQFNMLNKINASSVNTFRVNTFIEEDGSISVRYVFLRFGANNSRVDNLSSGGGMLLFDLEGNHSESAYNMKGKEMELKNENTGFEFPKIVIPRYKEMIEKCKEAHRRFPYVRLIGWDVCFDKEGNPIMLEWNADRPFFDIAEGKSGPFFADLHNLIPA